MEIFFNNIYKSRKTCLEMLNDRNYDTQNVAVYTERSFETILSNESLKIRETPFITPIDIYVKKIKTSKVNDYKEINYDFESEDDDDLSKVLEEISDDEEDEEDVEEKQEEGEFFGRTTTEYGDEINEYNDMPEKEDAHADSEAGIEGFELGGGGIEKSKSISNFTDKSVSISAQSQNVSNISSLDNSSSLSSKLSNQTGGAMDIEDEICVVKFIFDNKSISRSLEAITKLSKNIKNIIFVICSDDEKIFIKNPSTGRSSLNSNYKKFDYDNDDIQVFHYKQLIVNITHHKFVPKHELVETWEHQNILIKYSVKNKRGLPCILKTDPICRYYNGKIGDIFRIHRKDRFGKAIVYRCVHDDELDFEQQKFIEKSYLNQ